MSDAEIRRHLPLVRLILGRMRRGGQLSRHLDVEDLEAVGLWAVWEALRRWDPAQGTQATFLYSYVWGYAMKFQRQVTRAEGYHRDRGRIATVVSLDAPVDESGQTLLDVLAEEGNPTSEAREQFVALLHVGARLPDRQRIVAEHLLADAPLTGAARRLGISPAHTRKIAAGVRRHFADALA